MRRKLIIILILILGITGTVSARDIINGEECAIPANTVIAGDLFVLCNNLNVEGQIEGSIIGLSRTAIIHPTAKINGSIYLIAGELTVEGTIGKDVHFGGLILTIGENTEFEHEYGSVITANLTNTIEAGTVVPGNITEAGYQLIINGDVNNQINFWGSALHINGTVGDNVNATVGNSESTGASSQIETLLLPFFKLELIDPGLTLTRRGNINGDLEYRGPTEGVIMGRVEGASIYYAPETAVVDVNDFSQSARQFRRYFESVVREFITLIVVAAFLLLLVPKYIERPLRDLQVRPISVFGVGLLSFILSFPIVLIIASVSLVFMILLTRLALGNVAFFAGIVLGLANIGIASVFYFTAIYIGRVVFGLAIGKVIVRVLRIKPFESNLRNTILSTVIGVWILSMGVTVPIVGIVVNAIAMFMGLGAIMGVVREQFTHFQVKSCQP